MRKNLRDGLMCVVASAIVICSLGCGNLVAKEAYAVESIPVAKLNEVEDVTPIEDKVELIEASNVPGTYSRVDADWGATYSIVLKEDHTGMYKGQDDVPLTWDSERIYTDGYPYSYAVVENELFLNQDGIILTYTRENTANKKAADFRASSEETNDCA